MYVRPIKVKGHTYYQLVYSARRSGQSRQIHIRYLGKNIVKDLACLRQLSRNYDQITPLVREIEAIKQSPRFLEKTKLEREIELREKIEQLPIKKVEMPPLAAGKKSKYKQEVENKIKELREENKWVQERLFENPQELKGLKQRLAEIGQKEVSEAQKKQLIAKLRDRYQPLNHIKVNDLLSKKLTRKGKKIPKEHYEGLTFRYPREDYDNKFNVSGESGFYEAKLDFKEKALFIPPISSEGLTKQKLKWFYEFQLKQSIPKAIGTRVYHDFINEENRETYLRLFGKKRNVVLDIYTFREDYIKYLCGEFRKITPLNYTKEKYFELIETVVPNNNKQIEVLKNYMKYKEKKITKKQLMRLYPKPSEGKAKDAECFQEYTVKDDPRWLE